MKQKIMSKLKKIFLVLVFVAVSVFLGLIYNDMVSLNNPKFYKQGSDFYNKGDYQNAYFNYSKIKKISPLYKIALYKQAVCAENTKDYQTAIKKYNLFLHKYPNSIFSPKAKYRLAKCYFYSKDSEKAKEIFTNIQKHSPVEDYAIAANYYLGMLEKSTDVNKAKKYFSNYISLSPNGTYAMASAEELTTLKTEISPLQNLEIGEVCFYNQKYSSAVKYLKHAPLEKAWAYLSISYKQLGMYPQSKAYFETGIKHHSSKTNVEILHQAIDEYAAIQTGEKKQGWFKLSKLVQENKSVGEDYVLYNLTKYLDETHSQALYSRIVSKYPESEYAPEILWKMFWREYEAGNYKIAKKLGDEHLKKYSDSKSNPRMLYWMAKLALSKHKNVEANSYLNKIVSRYPDDYYAFRADSALKSTPNGWGTKSHHQLDERNFSIEFPIKYANLDIKDLKLINTVIELGDVNIWSEVNFDNKFVQSWFEYKKGNNSRSTLLAREGLSELDIKPPFSDDVYKLAYPIYWGQDINTNSKHLNLDPYLIISLIREESYFNPEAKSSTGALGLMQLMPSTAVYVASKYDLRYPTFKTLITPEKNITIGSYYFKHIKTLLANNDLMAIAAYNGGPNSVKYWQSDLKYKDFDEFVENIPYPETKTYVKKVYRTYWNYLNIYNY